MALVIPLLTLNKEMPVGISAFTLKSLSKAIIWFQPCIFVFQDNNKNIRMAPQKRIEAVITPRIGKYILTYLRLMFPPYKNQPIGMLQHII